MKKFFLAIAALGLLTGCGASKIVILSEETIKINGEEVTEKCLEEGYSFWGIFGSSSIEIKVGDKEAVTKDVGDQDYVITVEGTVKTASKEDLKVCEEDPPAADEEKDGDDETETNPDEAAKAAATALSTAVGELNAKVSEYNAAKAQAEGDPRAVENAAAKQRMSSAKAAIPPYIKDVEDKSAKAKAAAEQEGVSEEAKTAVNEAVTTGEAAIKAAKEAIAEATGS